MSDPYEEERRERFGGPIEPMLLILDRIRETLARAKDAPQGGQAMDLFDHAMDSVENQGEPTANFQWVVCLEDGSFRQGKEQSQRACEQAVERWLLS